MRDPAPGRSLMSIMVDLVQFFANTIYMTAFFVVLTTSLVLLTPGAEPVLGFDFDMGQMFLLMFAGYALYALTREWEGIHYGEASLEEANLERKAMGQESWPSRGTA